MTVYANKPAFNVREKLKELEKPSGVAGNAMLRAETPQEQFNLIGAGRKNLIINGGFDVWQRGTSFGSSSSFSADRWYINSGSATLSASQQAFLVGQTEVPYSPTYFLRVGIAGANTRQVLHKVEGLSRFSGQTVTLSYWAKSNVAVTPDCRILGLYDGSSTELLNSVANVAIGTDWSKYTHTFNIKSFSGKTIGPNSCLQLDWTFFDDSAYEFDIANVQLEFSSVATDFEHRSYGEELALCQRYYYRRTVNDNHPICTVNGEDNSTAVGYITFPAEMRSAPSFIYSGYTTFKVNAGTAFVLHANGLNVFGTNQCTAGVLVSLTTVMLKERAGQVRGNAAGAWVAFYAEL